jgi:hypothetical protein
MMKKSKLLLFLLSFFLQRLHSQNAFAGGFVQVNTFQTVQMYTMGAQVQFRPFQNGLMLNYEIGFGMTNDAKFAMHCNGGLPFALLLLVGDDSKPWLKLIGILGLALPKGISYAFPLKDNNELHLNINPLGLDFIAKNDAVYRPRVFSFSGDFGLSGFHQFDNGLYIKPYAGLKWLYGNGWLGFQGGMVLGKSIGM